MNRKIIRKVAKQNGVSFNQVKNEMQIAINAAYKKPNSAALAISQAGTVPTPEEFMRYCTTQLKEYF